MPKASDQPPNVPAPKKREWFKGPPKEIGVYWVRPRFYHGDKPPMVEVVIVAEARKGSLGWLLGNAGPVFDDIRHLYMFPCDSIAEEDERKRRIDEHLDAQEAGRTDVPDPTLEGWTPNEIRDWFCWLHRHFVYCAREGAL